MTRKSKQKMRVSSLITQFNPDYQNKQTNLVHHILNTNSTYSDDNDFEIEDEELPKSDNNERQSIQFTQLKFNTRAIRRLAYQKVHFIPKFFYIELRNFDKLLLYPKFHNSPFLKVILQYLVCYSLKTMNLKSLRKLLF